MNNEIALPTNNLPVTIQDRIAALRHRTAHAQEVWQPEPGECLIGEYIGHQQVEHPLYGSQWQVFLKDEVGAVFAVWANQWIRNSLKAQDISMGDLVAITYMGKRKTGAGKVYNAYSLIVDKDEHKPG